MRDWSATERTRVRLARCQETSCRECRADVVEGGEGGRGYWDASSAQTKARRQERDLWIAVTSERLQPEGKRGQDEDEDEDDRRWQQRQRSGRRRRRRRG